MRVLRIKGDKIIDNKAVKTSAKAFSRVSISSKLQVPKQPDSYEIKAEIIGVSQNPVRSWRKFDVIYDK